MIGEAAIRELGARGFTVEDGAFPPGAIAAARDEARALAAAGKLRPAGVSRGRRLDPGVRGDRIGWVDDPGPGLAGLVAAFEALQDELRAGAFLPLRRREIQLARYADGARYARHRDVFPGGPGRVITAIVYLVEDWDSGRDGGSLVIHAEPAVTIVPAPGRLVVFRSELEHEVLPALRERLALTCWYHGPEDLPR